MSDDTRITAVSCEGETIEEDSKNLIDAIREMSRNFQRARRSWLPYRAIRKSKKHTKGSGH
jgi:hypothetical protein